MPWLLHPSGEGWLPYKDFGWNPSFHQGSTLLNVVQVEQKDIPNSQAVHSSHGNAATEPMTLCTLGIPCSSNCTQGNHIHAWRVHLLWNFVTNFQMSARIKSSWATEVCHGCFSRLVRVGFHIRSQDEILLIIKVQHCWMQCKWSKKLFLTIERSTPLMVMLQRNQWWFVPLAFPVLATFPRQPYPYSRSRIKSDLSP